MKPTLCTIQSDIFAVKLVSKVYMYILVFMCSISISLCNNSNVETQENRGEYGEIFGPENIFSLLIFNVFLCAVRQFCTISNSFLSSIILPIFVGIKKLDDTWASCSCHPTSDEHVGLFVHPSGCHQINALLPNPPPFIMYQRPMSQLSDCFCVWCRCPQGDIVTHTHLFFFYYLLSASKTPFTFYFLDDQTCTVSSYGISASR